MRPKSPLRSGSAVARLVPMQLRHRDVIGQAPGPSRERAGNEPKDAA